MNVNITNEQIMTLVEDSVKADVRRRIDNSINNGIAGWFDQNNIQRLTYKILCQEYLPKITEDFIKGLNINLGEIASIIGKEVEKHLLKSFDLYDYNTDE